MESVIFKYTVLFQGHDQPVKVRLACGKDSTHDLLSFGYQEGTGIVVWVRHSSEKAADDPKEITIVPRWTGRPFERSMDDHYKATVTDPVSGLVYHLYQRVDCW